MKHQATAFSFSTLSLLIFIGLSCCPGSALAAWQLVWSDEFDGTSVDTNKWTFETGNNNGWGNSEREYYTGRTNNAYVAGGSLHIVARQESFGGFPYTSARMKTEGHYAKTYGRIEFRARIPQGVGYWPALWLLGSNISSVGWPACGEIDVLENNFSLNNNVQGTIHYSNPTNNNHLQQTKISALPNSVTNFHTYAIEWAVNSIKWVVDGVTVQTWTSWSSSTGPYPAPYNQPFFILMNVAVGGSYVGYPTDAQINAGTVFPGEMQVDYVRVYDDVAGPPATPTGLTASPGNAKVYLSWDASGSATNYNVKRGAVSGGPYATIASVPTNSYMDLSATNCGAYYYVVSASNGLGESTNSIEASARLGAFALAVNSGGSGAGTFAADANFSGGTQAAPTSAAIDTSGLIAPAPQGVYQTERYGNFTYTFNGLVTGAKYKVRLHLAEYYWSNVGQRRFNVFINGTQVLTNFDIIAVTGAQNKATIQEFSATAAGGQVTVQYVNVTDNAKSSGIEVLLALPGIPTGLAATAGDATVALAWNPAADAVSYNVKRSLTGGGPYSQIASGLTATNFVDSGLTNGTTYYYVVAAVNTGCETAVSAQASATPVCVPPATPAANNNSPIYSGMTLLLTASTVGGATYQWSGPAGFSSTNQNPVIPGATTNAAGLYSVTATAGSCVSTAATTTVVVNPPVTLSIQSTGAMQTINWPYGTLQGATNLDGSWYDLTNAVSPYPVTNTEPQQFYRIKVQ